MRAASRRSAGDIERRVDARRARRRSATCACPSAPPAGRRRATSRRRSARPRPSISQLERIAQRCGCRRAGSRAGGHRGPPWDVGGRSGRQRRRRAGCSHGERAAELLRRPAAGIAAAAAAGARAEATLDRLLDALRVETALREQTGGIAVLDEGVGQAEHAAPASRCRPRRAPRAPRCRRRPSTVPSSTVTSASWRRARSVTSATSSGLTKRMLATVASIRSAAASAG